MKLFLNRFLEARDMSLTDLTEQLGYKSKTSLNRILNGSVRASSYKQLESRILATYTLPVYDPTAGV